MVGQHWLSFFSTTQFCPTGLIKGHTLSMANVTIKETLDEAAEFDNDYTSVPEEAHEHLIVAGAVETRLVGDDLVPLVIVPVLVVATCAYLDFNDCWNHVLTANTHPSQGMQVLRCCKWNAIPQPRSSS